MKKNSVYGFMLVAFCFVLVSCGNVFSKVQIKAKPSIYAPLGKEEFKMSTYVTVEKIEELLGGKKEEGTDSSEGGTDFPFKIYDYDGDKDGALAFRLYYPLMDFDLDFGNYLEGMDLSSFKTAIPKIDFTVPKFEGLTLEQTVKGPPVPGGVSGEVNNENLPIENMSTEIPGKGFRSVTFGSGNAMYMTITPSSGSFTCTPDISVELPSTNGQTERVKFVQDTNDSKRYKADFGGKTIVPGELKFEGLITLNGTVSSDSNIKISITADLDKGFESATVAVPEGTKFEHTVDFKFPEEAKKMVEKVVFEKDNLGVIMSVVSTLPTVPTDNNNNITISMDAFGGAIQGEQTIEPNSPGDDKPKNIEFKNSLPYDLYPSNGVLSATIKVTPPGYNEGENTMTIKNVLPGASYSLSGEAKIIADWKSITLKNTATDPFTGSFPAAGAEPIDLSKFTELLPKEISFQGIGAALFISSPIQKEGSQSDLSFTGEVSISGGNGDPINLIPEDEKSLSLVNPVELPAEGNVWSGNLPTPSIDMGDGITKFLNSRPTSLNLDYSLSLGNETKIERKDIPEDGKTSVKAEIVITLPIKLSVTQNAEFDVFALANIPTDKDLFGRTEAPATNEQINDLLKMLTSLNIGIDYNNNLGVALGAKVHLLTDKDGNPTVTKDFMLEKGKNTYNLKLTGEQIKQVMEAYPFCPRVYVELPSGDVVLEREGGIDLSLGVTAVTDINYTYDLKGGN